MFDVRDFCEGDRVVVQDRHEILIGTVSSCSTMYESLWVKVDEYDGKKEVELLFFAHDDVTIVSIFIPLRRCQRTGRLSMNDDLVCKHFSFIRSLFQFYPVIEKVFQFGVLNNSKLEYLSGLIDGLYYADGLSMDSYLTALNEIQQYEIFLEEIG